MHRPGDELFAGARFAQDQDIGTGSGNGGETLNNSLHLGANADNVPQSLALLACTWDGMLEALQVGKSLHPSQHPVARLLDLGGAYQDHFLLTGLGPDLHFLI